MITKSETKSAVSVSEMASMLGLSRARIYQLIRKGALPSPDREEGTKRPFFNQEKQVQCLEVRRRNCGIDGKPILFYSKRRDSGARRSTNRASPAKDSLFGELVGYLAELEVRVTISQVETLVCQLFPEGTSATPKEEVFRAVFLAFQRQKPSDNAQR
jgi:excisionase family DNA binding protein